MTIRAVVSEFSAHSLKFWNPKAFTFSRNKDSTKDSSELSGNEKVLSADFITLFSKCL